MKKNIRKQKRNLQCFIECKNANSKINNDYVYGLFHGSEATKIEILSCGNNITDMSRMFCHCENLLSLDLSSLDTENVTNMSYMFFNCSKLVVLNLSNFNTTNVTNMRFMFYWCISLTNLNLSKFNTNNVTDMSWMFNWCSSLKELDLSSFNMNKVKDMRSMFNNCFTEQQPSTLICQASTIQKIADEGGLRLTIQYENENDINNIIENNNNLEQVYICSVERVIEEYYAEVEGPKIIVM